MGETWKKIYQGESLVGADGESILSVTERLVPDPSTLSGKGIRYFVRMSGEAGEGKPFKTKHRAYKYAREIVGGSK